MKRYLLTCILMICAVLPATAFDEVRVPSGERPVFYVFHSLNCVRCRDAVSFVSELESRYPGIEFKILEVAKSRENQEIFNSLAMDLGITTPGVPVFIFGESYLVGFGEGKKARRQVITMIEYELGRRRSSPSRMDIPLFGTVDPHALSLPLFTVVLGLIDGINPCALWVLMLLLGLLVNARSRRKMILVGGIFIFCSAMIYFLFMTAWLNFFTLLRFRDTATLLLGIGVCLLGVLNVKELFWFRKGPTLVIPAGAKSRIYELMRKIVLSPNTLFLVLGTSLLVFFVNLAEFGCTAGLPAVYTRVLSLQQVWAGARYIYMGVYTTFYILPLLTVLIIFALTLGRYRLPQNAAKALKAAGGAVMLSLGLLLIFRPELLKI